MFGMPPALLSSARTCLGSQFASSDGSVFFNVHRNYTTTAIVTVTALATITTTVMITVTVTVTVMHNSHGCSNMYLVTS